MAKDPAFLFYSKDWLEGTAEMSKEAKGIFIDLLAHHHQKDSLPSDTKKLSRLAGMSETDFLAVWDAELSIKFYQDGDRLYNRKLTEVMTERLEKGHRNRIIGCLAVAVRLSQAPVKMKAEAKKGFKIDDFLTYDDHELTERVTEWFTSRLKSIAIVNGNEDIGFKGVGPGETIEGVPFNFDTTLPDLTLEAAEMNQFTHTGQKNTQFVKQMWETFVKERQGDPLTVRKKSLSDLCGHFLNFLRNKFPKNGTNQTSVTGSNGQHAVGKSNIDKYQEWINR